MVLNLWGGADKINEWKGVNYPPVHVRFIQGQLVVTDYYNPEYKEITGLEIGDVIASINGKSVPKIVEEKAKFPRFLQNCKLSVTCGT